MHRVDQLLQLIPIVTSWIQGETSDVEIRAGRVSSAINEAASLFDAQARARVREASLPRALAEGIGIAINEGFAESSPFRVLRAAGSIDTRVVSANPLTSSPSKRAAYCQSRGSSRTIQFQMRTWSYGITSWSPSSTPSAKSSWSTFSLYEYAGHGILSLPRRIGLALAAVEPRAHSPRDPSRVGGAGNSGLRRRSYASSRENWSGTREESRLSNWRCLSAKFRSATSYRCPTLCARLATSCGQANHCMSTLRG